jgi:hypothetical protein
MNMSTLIVPSRSMQPTKDAIDFLAANLGGDTVRLISLDTRNPLGGRGGSLDSDQCAWLVRELATEPHRGVIVATRHRSHELRNTRTAQDGAPRILGDELVSLLLAHANVLGWISGSRHRPAATRHGVRDSGLWEMTPSLLGFGCKAWLGHQRRRSVSFGVERALAPSSLALATA